MIDWTKEEHFAVEDVEHEVFILGVKWAVFPWMLFLGLALAHVSFYFLFLAPLLVWVLARKYYSAQKENKPLEYSKKFLVRVIKHPVFVPLFRAAANIKQNRGEYK